MHETPGRDKTKAGKKKQQERANTKQTPLLPEEHSTEAKLTSPRAYPTYSTGAARPDRQD